tara:strand:+ start:634 stop:858 length:225 start_codon:yes stop_codon:yes gene_type:complete
MDSHVIRNAKLQSVNAMFQDIAESPGIKKRVYTRKAKRAHKKTTRLMKDVLSNPEDYTDETRRQAHFMKNILKE